MYDGPYDELFDHNGDGEIDMGERIAEYQYIEDSDSDDYDDDDDDD